MEVGTLLLGNDKNNVIVNYLLSFYLKGHLKSRINKLLRKKSKYQFSVRRCGFIKDITLSSFLIQHLQKPIA